MSARARADLDKLATSLATLSGLLPQARMSAAERLAGLNAYAAWRAAQPAETFR